MFLKIIMNELLIHHFHNFSSDIVFRLDIFHYDVIIDNTQNESET